MKILMTTDTVGGVLVYTAALAGALRRWNVSILLAAMGGPLSQEWRIHLKALGNVRIFESDYKLEWMDDPWADVANAGRWLMRLCERFTPDVIHFNNYMHALLDWPCPTLVVGHSCVYSWYRDVQGTAPEACWKKYFCCVSRAIKRADLVTAPTWCFLKRLKELYGPFRSNGAIYNGLNSDAADCEMTKEPMIFAAGRLWDQGKNIEILKRVQPLVETPIYTAGSLLHPDGSIADTGNLRHVGLLSAPQMKTWYAKSAVYVLPALYEPFGLSALEAAQAGCALVLADIPSLREVWADAAMFVDPRDAKSIAAALNLLMKDGQLRDDCARRARMRARLYTADKMARRYVAVYSKLMKHEPLYSQTVAAMS